MLRIGILKKENIIYGNALNEEEYLIYVGSKTGAEELMVQQWRVNHFQIVII